MKKINDMSVTCHKILTCHNDIQNFQYDMSCHIDMSFNVIYSNNFNRNFWVKFREKIKIDEIVHLNTVF